MIHTQGVADVGHFTVLISRSNSGIFYFVSFNARIKCPLVIYIEKKNLKTRKDVIIFCYRSLRDGELCQKLLGV